MRWPLDIYFVSQGYSTSHPAIDLAAPTGTAVKSPVSGKVIAVGTNPKYEGGLYVIVREDGGQGREFYTGHHSSLNVRFDQYVREGDTIAFVGATGKATGAHVHFQIRRNNAGSLLNPLDVINAKVLGDSTMAGQPNPNVDEGGLNTLYEAYFGRQPDKAARSWIGQPWQLAIYGIATSEEMKQKRQRDAEVYAFYEANKGKTIPSPAALQLEQLIKQIAKES